MGRIYRYVWGFSTTLAFTIGGASAANFPAPQPPAVIPDNQEIEQSLALVNSTAEFAVAVVPEPATWIMMMLGFALIALQMRRQSRAQVEMA